MENLKEYYPIESKVKEVVVPDGYLNASNLFAVVFIKALNPSVSIIRESDMAIESSEQLVLSKIDTNQYRLDGSKYNVFGILWKEFGSKFVGDALADIIEDEFVKEVESSDNMYERILSVSPSLENGIMFASTILSRIYTYYTNANKKAQTV